MKLKRYSFEDFEDEQALALNEQVPLELSTFELENDLESERRLHTEVGSDLAVSERNLDASAVLEGFLVSLEGLQLDQPMDQKIAASMAREVIGQHPNLALESYLEGTLSLEGIKETLRHIWEQIKKATEAIWHKLTMLFQKVRVRALALKNRLRDQVLDTISAIADTAKPSSSDLRLQVGIAQRLNVSGQIPGHYEEVVHNVDMMIAADKFITHDYVALLTQRMRAIQVVVGKFNPEDPKASVEAVHAVLQMGDTLSIPHNLAHLMGGVTLVYSERHLNLVVSRTVETEHRGGSFRALKPSELKKLVQKTGALIDSKSTVVDAVGQMSKAASSLYDATSQMIQSVRGDTPLTEGTTTAIRALGRLSQFHARWTHDALAHYAEYTMPVTEGLYGLIEDNRQLYK